MLISHLQTNRNTVESLFPRVMNKLTVCVYPMATIRPEVSELEKAGIMLHPDTLCTDSYIGIKEIFKNREGSKYLKTNMDFIHLVHPTSYSLINLHKLLLGCSPTQSHDAEADCLTLIRTTAVLGNTWIEWAQENCYQFSRCAKMWSFRAL